MKILRHLIALLTIVLVLAPAALANPSTNQYGSQINSVTPPPPSSETLSATTSGDLPFTGLEIGLVVVAGGVLAVVGFGVRRLAGRRS